MKIPITKPFFDDSEKKAILGPLETGWVVQGEYVAEFERLFADFTGARFAVAASSCTTALHLGLDALGVSGGDRVIVPCFTFVASANSVEYTGAEPVFCDIDLKTFNINLEKAAEILEKDKKKKIKAIMPVNLFGLCADLPGVMRLAKKYKLKVLEDSACGLGATIGGRHSGAFGDAGAFSFHPRKAITTGEGGMLVTNKKAVAGTAASLRDHGAGKSDLRRHTEKGGSLLPDFNLRGYNYRMTDLQGALGVCQMRKAGFILKSRRALARRYNKALKDVPGIIPPAVPDGHTHGYQAYVCLYSMGEDLSKLNIKLVDRLNRERNAFMEKLEEKGIATRQGTHAVHTLGYYRKKYGLRDGDFIASYAADRLSVAFPLYPGMTDEEFEYVVSNVRRLV